MTLEEMAEGMPEGADHGGGGVVGPSFEYAICAVIGLLLCWLN